jgi:putative acetyltransferase
LGHALLSKLDAPMRALALAPVAVHPESQRQGIGSALIRKPIENAGDAGWEAIFVLGDAGYYSRLGFPVGAAKGYFSGYSGKNFMMLLLGTSKIPTSGRLVYPRPFDQLE